MSHPAHIILRGGVGDETDGDYSVGTVTIKWNTPAGMDHEEVGRRVKRMLDLEEEIYHCMKAP